MSKIMTRWWWMIVLFFLVSIFVYGYVKMYFHQDDLDWMLMVDKPFWHVIMAPLGDHIDYLFRLLFKVEWQLFGFSFPPYLFVSLALHGITIWLLYRLAYATSSRADLSAVAALFFTINTNLSEVVLWTSGQTISISALFVILAMWAMWEKKGIFATQILASWTSALALGLPIATFLSYGVNWERRCINRIGWGVGVVMLHVAILYAWFATDGTHLLLSWRWLLQVIMVSILAIENSVIGRFFIPFDRFELIRIWIMGVGGVGVLYRFRTYWASVLKDTWSRFLILQLGFYYLIVAVGRAQYGIGIMRADRYGYLGLALVLLLLVRVLRNWKIGGWIWLVPFFLCLQSVGFYTRARVYVLRPEGLREVVVHIEQLDTKTCYRDRYLPHFVFNGDHLKYSDLMNLMGHGKWHLGETVDCLALPD